MSTTTQLETHRCTGVNAAHPEASEPPSFKAGQNSVFQDEPKFCG
jgi:hypothetical protein